MYNMTLFYAPKAPGRVRMIDPILETGFLSDFSWKIRDVRHFELNKKLLYTEFRIDWYIILPLSDTRDLFLIMILSYETLVAFLVIKQAWMMY